jgi:cytochrome c nitrite reductase small subunit
MFPGGHRTVPRRTAFITALGLPGLAAVCVGVVLGLGGYTFWYGEGLSYMSDSPLTCVNCHIMREHYDGWQKASHHNVAVCNDCHTPHNLVGKYLTKAENGIWHSKAFTLQDFHDPLIIRPKNARVLQGACVECHRELADTVLGHGTAEDGGAAYCARCHAAVGHGPAK